MSLSGFQRALARLVLSAPDIRRLAGGDDRGLSAFDLTDRERERLRSVARQPGIWLCCSLARANRFEAIADAYPMTCVVLEPGLRELLDEVWSTTPPTNYQFQGEEALFAARVEAGLATGTLTGEYLEEVFRYEAACWGLAQWLRRPHDGADPPRATVMFRHPPDRLLEPLSRLVAPPPGLPRGEYLVEVRLENGDFSVDVLSATTDA